MGGQQSFAVTGIVPPQGSADGGEMNSHWSKMGFVALGTLFDFCVLQSSHMKNGNDSINPKTWLLRKKNANM
jgi:hypothetical protein